MSFVHSTSVQRGEISAYLAAGYSNCLFFLHNGRPMPPSKKQDPLYLQHGFQRNPLMPRGYSQPFSTDASAARLLKLRALFGVNARCEILDYLARNGTGHPREIARELYYSQKAIHDTLTDLACSGVIQSSKGARERVFRLSPGSLSFLDRDADGMGWITSHLLRSTDRKVHRLHPTSGRFWHGLPRSASIVNSTRKLAAKPPPNNSTPSPPGP